MNPHGIFEQQVDATPIAVIDFETTGLTPGVDRVVEASVVRVEPGGTTTTMLDTLVNPCRRMAATEIHGITDADVAGAPRFSEIAPSFVEAIAGCVVASYNIYFDIRFLEYELGQAGFDTLPPHLCVMYLRPMLGMGKRCALAEACRLHDIRYIGAHTALADTEAAVKVLAICLAAAQQKRIHTFAELAKLKSYRFLQSFEYLPLRVNGRPSGTGCRFKSRSLATQRRSEQPATQTPDTAESGARENVMHLYWDELKTVIADLEVTDDEITHLLQTKRELGLRDEQTRVLHARAFASVISQFTADQWLDDRECRKLRLLRSCLSKAGWAPGD